MIKKVLCFTQALFSKGYELHGITRKLLNVYPIHLFGLQAQTSARDGITKVYVVFLKA